MPNQDKVRDLDELGKELEQEIKGPDWSTAHEKYYDDQPEMLENLVHQKALQHGIDVLKDFNGPFFSTGRPNWSEADVFITGLTATALMFLIHPVVFALWLAIPIAGIKRHHKACKGSEEKIKRLTLKVAYDLHYYLTSSAIVAYYFIEIEGRTLAFSDAGTTATVLLELLKLFGF